MPGLSQAHLEWWRRPGGAVVREPRHAMTGRAEGIPLPETGRVPRSAAVAQ